jgi:hypothetical protein
MPQVGAGFRDNAIDRIVIAGWVVVRQGNSFNSCGATNRYCVLNGAMPPADLLWVLLSNVLGVVDDEVRAREKLAMPQVFAANLACSIGKMPGMRLVIRCINDRRTLGLKPVTKRQRGVIQVAGPDRDVSDPKGSFYQLMVSDLCAELVQLYRKIGILHLAFESVAQRLAHSLGGVKVPLIASRKERSEERDALDVVPMRVADKNVPLKSRRLSRKQMLPEPTDASPAINDY